MRYFCSLMLVMLLAGPSLAHDVGHAHAHGDEGWGVAFALMALFGLSFLVWRRRQ